MRVVPHVRSTLNNVRRRAALESGAPGTTRNLVPLVRARSREGHGESPPRPSSTRPPHLPRVVAGDNVLSWYTCGPTVYDDAHLGHARTYVSVDILQRILEGKFGYRVRHVVNITDVDDKIIQRASESGVEWSGLAHKYERRFWKDMTRLGVRIPLIARVSEYMPEIVDYVRVLEERGYAYRTDDGSVFFDSASCDGYGTFIGGGALASGEGWEGSGIPGKRDVRDFALWKAAKKGEPSWPSPWGRGRPGWHVECSAVTSALFGPQLDVHAGGLDLQFPHHENEVAQCRMHQGLDRGEDWPRFFLHLGHLHIAGRKMSKSLKNFITVSEMLDSGITPETFRTFCLLHRYSDSITYRDEGIMEALSAQARFRDLIASISAREDNDQDDGVNPTRARRWNNEEWALWESIQSCDANVTHALAEDFNTARAIQLLGELTKEVNLFLSEHPTGYFEVLHHAKVFVQEMLDLYGISDPESRSEEDSTEKRLVQVVLDTRRHLRQIATDKSRDASGLRSAIFGLSDAIRDEQLPRLGFDVRDSAGREVIARRSRKQT